MTAYDLVTRYQQEHGTLPPEGCEVTELQAFGQRIGITPPEADSILAVCQTFRQRQQEAAGQWRLF